MRLFLAHEPAILRSVLVFVPQRHDARDIVQETAVALWRNFGEFDPARPFVNWACGFARMEVRRFLRRSQRRAVLSEQAVVALLVLLCYFPLKTSIKSVTYYVTLPMEILVFLAMNLTE